MADRALTTAISAAMFGMDLAIVEERDLTSATTSPTS